MLKFCIEQWNKNKDKLRKDIEDNFAEYNNASYKDLVVKVVDIIFNDEDDYYGDKFDSENITEIDNGDYQGTLLYIIPQDTYQPSESEYLMTYVGYGSCSGCDTLQAIQMWSFDDEDVRDDEKEQFIKDMLGLCLNLVQNTIKPYNYGWRKDDRFTVVED
ncbi:hypothetical protein NST17_20085 [Caldifermentibacillus hisashii]|uniref:Immunity protein Imm6 n=1 Tax=Caldifermentibacillus hisashii TaxID=996558 RepID=A0ABU9K2W9_9BACI